MRRLAAILSTVLLGVCTYAQVPQSSFPPQNLTGSGQTTTPYGLLGWAYGTVEIVGTSVSAVTFTAQGSNDGGSNYFPLPVAPITSPGTIATSQTANAPTLYAIGLSGITNIRFVTSGTFTGTNVRVKLTASGASGSYGGGGGGSPGVNSINGNTGAFLFTGGGVNCTGVSCVFSGGGGLSSFTVGPLSPLFTASLGANPTTAPALAFTLSNAAAHTVFGNNAGTTGQPQYFSLTYGDITGLVPTWNQSTTGNAATATLATNATNAVNATTAATATNALAYGGVVISGTAASGYVPVASDSTHATWTAQGGLSGLTPKMLVQAVSATTVGNSFIDYDTTIAGQYWSSKIFNAPGIGFDDGTSAGGGWDLTEGGAGTCTSGHDPFWADLTAHRLKTCFNGGSATNILTAADQLPNVQITMPTTAISATSCTSASTTTLTGVTTTTAFRMGFATDPSGVTGWGSSGGLGFYAWPTSNTINWRVCNVTSSSITPGAMTINVGAQ